MLHSVARQEIIAKSVHSKILQGLDQKLYESMRPFWLARQCNVCVCVSSARKIWMQVPNRSEVVLQACFAVGQLLLFGVIAAILLASIVHTWEATAFSANIFPTCLQLLQLWKKCLRHCLTVNRILMNWQM